jgi:hypothetical protein
MKHIGLTAADLVQLELICDRPLNYQEKKGLKQLLQQIRS